MMQSIRPFSLDRRSFMGGLAAAGLTSSLARTAHAATPKRGGTLIIGSRHGATSDTTDPALISNGFQWMLCYAMASTLTELLPDGTIGPSLAESWETTDTKTWRFKIRSDVQFHDGKIMTLDDVIASINYHRGPQSKSFMKTIADNISDIRKDGADGIVFELQNPNADFPTSLNTPGFTVYAAKGDGIDWSSGNATGGYVLKSYEPGVKAVLQRHPNYFRTDRAFADEVHMLTIADPIARTAALLSGEVHVVDDVDLKIAEQMKQQPDIQVETLSGPFHFAFSMRTDMAPFNDVNVRRALKHALNRDELMEKTLQGYGTLGNDNPIGPSYRYHARDIAQNSFNPEKAREYLQKAGLSELKIELSAADAAFTGAVDAALLFKEQAKAANIEIEVVREPNDGYWENVWMKKPFVASYWGGYPTESEMFSVGYSPGAAWNETYWTEKRFEELRLASLAEQDPEIRKTMYREMQEILRDDGGIIAFAFPNYVTAKRANVQHGEVAANNALDGRRIAERWWLSE